MTLWEWKSTLTCLTLKFQHSSFCCAGTDRSRHPYSLGPATGQEGLMSTRSGARSDRIGGAPLKRQRGSPKQTNHPRTPQWSHPTPQDSFICKPPKLSTRPDTKPNPAHTYIKILINALRSSLLYAGWQKTTVIRGQQGYINISQFKTMDYDATTFSWVKLRLAYTMRAVKKTGLAVCFSHTIRSF